MAKLHEVHQSRQRIHVMEKRNAFALYGADLHLPHMPVSYTHLLGWFQPSERLNENLVRILPETRLVGGMGAGNPTYEIAMAQTFDVPIYGISLRNGLPGVKHALEIIAKEHDCQLFISADRCV